MTEFNQVGILVEVDDGDGGGVDVDVPVDMNSNNETDKHHHQIRDLKKTLVNIKQSVNRAINLVGGEDSDGGMGGDDQMINH